MRHFEIIPGEESPLEVRSAKLSYNFSSPIDLIRRYPLLNLMSNPFAPLEFSTTHTIWSLDPIYSAQSKVLRLLDSLPNDPKNERVKGLFGDAIKWLIKNLGLKVIDWGRDKIADMVDAPRVKGLDVTSEDDEGCDDDVSVD